MMVTIRNIPMVELLLLLEELLLTTSADTLCDGAVWLSCSVLAGEEDDVEEEGKEEALVV